MSTPKVPSKRGRKPKKILTQEEVNNNDNNNNNNDNIINNIQTQDIDTNNIIPVSDDNVNENENISSLPHEDENTKSTVVFKKRGRKPKGGKIIQQNTCLNEMSEIRPNIILHLKCCLKDLQTSTILMPNVESFDIQKNHNPLSYEILYNYMKISFIQKN
jgi:hypothetical protein